MRASGAMLGVIGVGVWAAAAAGQGPRRGAVLLPPRPVDPAELPVVARASAAELPPFPGSTPVQRAGGAVPEYPRPEPSPVARGIDKLKSTFAAESPARPAATAAPTPDAHSPFRGTTPTGAPVYAGPPAYRWYGWGSVTPGGNPFAPAGQYPRASANWHAITGATPGAFPVPVADPTRPPPGPEPPAYAAAPVVRTPPAAPPPPPTGYYSAEPPRAAPLPPAGGPPPVATPTLTIPPAAAGDPAGPRVVVTSPLTLAPLLPRPADPGPAPPLPTLPPVAVPAGGAAEPPKPAAPAADEPSRWQPNPAPGGGEWTPAPR